MPSSISGLFWTTSKNLLTVGLLSDVHAIALYVEDIELLCSNLRKLVYHNGMSALWKPVIEIEVTEEMKCLESLNLIQTVQEGKPMASHIGTSWHKLEKQLGKLLTLRILYPVSSLFYEARSLEIKGTLNS